MAQPALPLASKVCLGEVSDSQFPAGRVPAHDFALVRALFLLLQRRPFLGRFCLCQERHEYSMRGKTLIAFAQQPTSKHFPMFLHLCMEMLIRVFQREAVSFWKGQGGGKKSGSHVIDNVLQVLLAFGGLWRIQDTSAGTGRSWAELITQRRKGGQEPSRW